LFVLGVYAWDTRKLRLVAQQQLENAITPCVVITANPQRLGIDGAIEMENIGVGTALNVRFSFVDTISWSSAPAIPARGHIAVAFRIKDILNHGKQVICEFESLSGTRYRTLSIVPDDTKHFDLEHRFERLSGSSA
jgi:hypothetical protein